MHDYRPSAGPARVQSGFSRLILCWLVGGGLAGAGCAHPAAVPDAGPRLALAPTGVAAGVPVHAAQPGASVYTPAPEPVPIGWRKQSYRGQMALYDAIGGVFGVGLFLGGPVAHLANDEPGHALASLGLRLGGTVVGTLAGVGAMVLLDFNCDSSAPDCGGGLIVLGMAGGLVTGFVLDYVYLGEKRVPVYGQPVYLRPSLLIDRERATAGVQLRF